MVVTKVAVTSVETTGGWDGKQKPQNKRIKMTIVSGGSAENQMFNQISGGTAIDLQTINPQASDQFEVGQEKYVVFMTPEEYELHKKLQAMAE